MYRFFSLMLQILCCLMLQTSTRVCFWNVRNLSILSSPLTQRSAEKCCTDQRRNMPLICLGSDDCAASEGGGLPSCSYSCLVFSCPDESLTAQYVTLSLSEWLSDWVTLLILSSKTNPRDLWPLRLMTRVMMRHNLTKKRQWQRQRQRQWQIHLENTFKERS